MAHIVFLLVIDDEMAADSGMKRWYGAVEFSPWVKSWWCSSTVMSDSATPWTVAPQLLCPWDSQARILEWVAISSSRGSSWPRDRTCVSCVSWPSRWILYHWATWKATLNGLETLTGYFPRWIHLCIREVWRKGHQRPFSVLKAPRWPCHFP